MTMLFIIIALVIILFKDQAKQILEAVVRLLVALADAIVSGIK